MDKFKQATFLAFMAIALSCASAYPADRTYVNPRFGTTITFPAEVFSKSGPVSENGDGMRWSSPDGGSLAVWGQFNALDDTPQTLADRIAGTIPEVTYRKVGSNWTVVSGFDGDEIVYHRSEFSRSRTIHSLELRYPATQSRHYDRLAGRIADSLIGP